MTSSRISIKEVKPKNLASSKTPSKKQKILITLIHESYLCTKIHFYFRNHALADGHPSGCASPSTFMYCDRQTDNVPSGLMSLSSTSCPCRR